MRRVPQILQLCQTEPYDCLPGRPEKAEDSTEPDPVSGRAASSTHSQQPLALPLFSLLAARPLRRALPRPSPPTPSVTPPTSGEQETRGLAEGRQVGEAGQGEGVTLDSSAQVHLTAAAGTSDAP